MELLGVTYSQFDNTLGTKLLYSYPPTIILRTEPQEVTLADVFECLADYVILGKHLCGKVIAVRTEDVHFVNFSMAIDNPKYGRNTLLYSFGFALSLTADVEPFENILRKISYLFLQVELEREFLYQESTRDTIQQILRNLYLDLVNNGEAFLELDIANVIAVKLIRQPKIPAPINEFEVPILCIDNGSRHLLTYLPWDISIRHLLNHIDGVSFAKKLAMKPEVAMDVHIVKSCLRRLVHYNCVIMSDILRFSNIYQLSTLGKEFVINISNNRSGSYRMLWELVQFSSSVRQQIPLSSNSIASDRVSSMKQYARCIQRFLCSLSPGVPLSQVISSLGKSFKWHGINLRRLLAYCQHRGLIRRIHEYPVDLFLSSEISSSLAAIHFGKKGSDPTCSSDQYQGSDALALVGLQSLDAICARYSLDPSVVLNMCGVCVIYK